MLLYAVWSRITDAIVGDLQWKRRVVGSVFCSNCKGILAGVYPQPIDVYLSSPPKGIGGPVWIAGVSVFRREFIELVRPHLKDRVFGRCFHQDTSRMPAEIDPAEPQIHPEPTLIQQYIVCYGSNELFVRGGPDTEYESCPVCGRIQRTDPPNDFSIVRNDLDANVIYQDKIGTMYLHENLVAQLDLSLFKDLRLRAVPVLDRPLDGQRLPWDPDWNTA